MTEAQDFDTRIADILARLDDFDAKLGDAEQCARKYEAPRSFKRTRSQGGAA